MSCPPRHFWEHSLHFVRQDSGSTPYILCGVCGTRAAVGWKMFTFLQIDHRCWKIYGRSSSWWSRKSGQGTQWIPVVHGCQWVMSFESDAGWCWLPGSELQHPELNYGPGISGELRVTHDSHQEPHPEGVREMELNKQLSNTVPFDEKNPIF